MLSLAWAIACNANASTSLANGLFSNAGEARAFLAAAETLKRGDWLGLHQNRQNIRDPQALVLLEYLELKIRGETVGFQRLERFLLSNASRLDWFPGIPQLRRHAERALARETFSPQRILDHLNRFPPQSGIGIELLGEALLKTGRREEGEAAIRRAWREHSTFFPRSRDFFRRHSSLLTKQDHLARMHMLLWREEVTLAKEVLSLLGSDERALAVARERLMTRTPGVDAAIRAVPARLQQDPGLIYERVRWRRRMNLREEAIELLLQAPPPAPEHARKWWVERHILARHALQQGQYLEAYELARSHGMERGIGFADGEFLAGWLALRFLDRPARAHEHFNTLQSGVSTPVSLARAGYWLGRAAQAMVQQFGPANAPDPYLAWRDASSFFTTFYGQLAQEMLQDDDAIPMEKVNRDVPAPAASFVPGAGAHVRESDRDFLRIVYLAYGAGYEDTGEQFLLRRSRQVEEENEFSLLSKAAERLGQPHISVRIAKRGARKHIILENFLFPVDVFPPRALETAGRLVEPALLLAIARQESEFDAKAVSRAGARGMMQLLPSTARQVAGFHDIGYDNAALLQDAAYNVRLGELYLGEMIARFEGSYVLAIAAYNAGPARVTGWLGTICDPRQPKCDSIDWIEKIPIGETRNYVQRVLENLQNYRRILVQPETGGLNLDLRRGEESAAIRIPVSPRREP